MLPRTLLLRPQCVRVLPICPARLVLRPYSSSPASKVPGPRSVDPNPDNLPNAPEEAAAMAKITGETPPAIDQGTPIAEIIKRDPAAQKWAPAVLKKGLTPGSKREYSTSTFWAPSDGLDKHVPELEADLAPASEAVAQAAPASLLPVGAKFPLPDLPLPSNCHIHHRYSPIVEQVTNLIMKDGKKATAQSVMTKVLAILRTKSAPKSNPRTPIIPTAPPLGSLPSDPVAFLQTAIDSVAPLLQIKSTQGSGGFREQVPIPMALRQRRRRAVMWIIEAADKKKARMTLAERFAEEIVAVVEGSSSAWLKRAQVHKTAVSSRANVKVKVM